MSANELEKACSVHHNSTFNTNYRSVCPLCESDQQKDGEQARLDRELEERRQKIKKRVELKEKELEELRRRSSSADAVLKLSKDTFSKMIELMKETSKSVEQQFRSLQHGVQTGFHVHLDLINEDIEDLKEQISHRESFLKTQDTYEFLLQNNALLEMPKVPKKRHTFCHWLPLRKFALDINHDPMCLMTLPIFHEARPTVCLYTDFLDWEATFRTITWDLNTAHRNVALQTTCKGNKWAIFKSQPRHYRDHPDRFTDCVQVLSREPLTGRCYFEVYPRGDCFIGLTYKSIERKGKGKQCVLGLNDKSWACSGGGFVSQSTKNGTWLVVPNMSSNKVAVLLDHRRGILRFYSVIGQGLSILYEVESKFTKPLYFGAVFMTPGDHVVIPKV